MFRTSFVAHRIHARQEVHSVAGRATKHLRKRLVCALGGNALKQPGQKGTLDEMMHNALVVAASLAKVRAGMGYDICLTHGNGPQVGAIFLQNELARKDIPPMPLYICGAESQGQLGYILQTALETELQKSNTNSCRPPAQVAHANTTVVQLGTRVRVDAGDPAFQHPTKPIGSFYSAAEAKDMMAMGKTMVEDAGRGWRVVVPSPNPVEIVEAKAIKKLLDAGMTIVSCGGGGIPVVYDATRRIPLDGVDAVIDKDLAGERLATLVDANVFMILTDIDGVYLHHRDAEKRQLVHEATPQELRAWAKEGHFAAGSMGPKVEAVCRFVEGNPTCVAYITSLEQVSATLEGRAGTCISINAGGGVPQQLPINKPSTSTVLVSKPTFTPSSWSAREEWGQPVNILMHRPNDCGELNVPVIHPAAALFEQGFDPDDAAADHQRYVALLEERGATVVLLKDLLTSKARESDAWMEKLRNVAKSCVALDLSAIPESEHAAHREAVMTSIDTLHPKHLVDTIVNCPSIKPQSTDTNTHLQARYEVRPEMNLFFCRDQMITTAKGPVLANMNSTQRVAEVRLVKLALEALGTPAIFAVTGDGRLEGGDFIPAGDWAFQGQGLRTNKSAVEQLLAADVYGTRFVCVVKDTWRNQEEMHLDTYFNIAGSDVCTLVETRCRRSQLCDVYERHQDAGYQLLGKNCCFMDVLKQAGFKCIVPVPKSDQLIYGCNYLTMGDKDIILVKRGDGVSEQYKSDLRAAGVKFVECEMSSLTKGYGAAHCTTQVSRHRTK